jgi:hypothetical protein
MFTNFATTHKKSEKREEKMKREKKMEEGKKNVHLFLSL